MATTFILGAGFSIPAGFPSGQTLNQKFFYNVENNILKFSSGEWSWDEYGKVESNNGRLNHEHLNISYLLSELVARFQDEVLLPFDYEEFFDWINRDYSKEFITSACMKVNERLKAEKKHITYLFHNPDINQYLQIQESYIYLIADLLNRNYKREENIQLYSSVLKIICEQNSDIFTLNHDLLLEFLFSKKEISYSDGFTTNNSLLINENRESIPTFQDYYPERLKLYKLHGSIDYYRFSEMKESSGNWYERTGNFWFFKTQNYWDKHGAIQINPTTREIVQHLNPDIKPQFLTGKSKLSLIETHKIYKTLYKKLEDSLLTNKRLIIIGYSYRDIHINKLILKTLKSNPCEIININPYFDFPFRRDYSFKNIINLKNIAEI